MNSALARKILYAVCGVVVGASISQVRQQTLTVLNRAAYHDMRMLARGEIVDASIASEYARFGNFLIADVDYKYQVAEETYYGDSVANATLKKQKEIFDRLGYKVGDQIDVWFDPADPNRSNLVGNGLDVSVIIQIIWVLIAGGVGFLAAILTDAK